MLSAISYNKRSLATMPYKRQLPNQRFTFLGLLILKFNFFYFLDFKLQQIETKLILIVLNPAHVML